MQADDDELWRSIVDNYGDRVELDPDDDESADPPSSSQTPPSTPPASPPSPSTPPAPPSGAPQVPPPAPPSTGATWDSPYPDADWTQDRFVPPAPPPLPTTTQDRFLAWLGVVAAPALLIAFLILGVSVPQIVVLVLVAAFVGGFLYLIVTMSGEPRDPGDDGARL